VMSDSDVRVGADYLKVIAPPFADPQVGVVTGFYRCITAGGVAADLDALGMYLDSAPGALVARRLEGKMQFAFGWTMATTKKQLSEIGGWEAMANYHSDDFELGNRIARRGYRVELMRKPVWMVFPQETIAQFFRHELRWSIGLKNVRPTGYQWLVLTHGLPWALLAAGCAARAGWEGIASVSDRILGVAPRAGLDDGQLGPGRCRSMEETVASPGARCNQFCRMGGRILFRTHPMAGNCLPREEWATLPNGGCEPGERWRCARIERHYKF